MKRSLSGIQPSGVLHIGNYFGAIKQFIENQDKYEGFYFVVDYHALTSLKDPKALRENTYNAILDFLALGLDPEKSTIFVQSDVGSESLQLGHVRESVKENGISYNTVTVSCAHQRHPLRFQVGRKTRERCRCYIYRLTAFGTPAINGVAVFFYIYTCVSQFCE